MRPGYPTAHRHLVPAGTLASPLVTISRRSLLAASGVAALAAPPVITQGRANQAAIRIGCLTDLNGPYADLVGKGVVGSTNLAIEDFHHLHPDIAVELLCLTST